MCLRPDLFRTLADLTGCMYISDLQFLPRQQVLEAAQQLSAEQFPARDWIDALCYFSDQYQWSDPQVHAFSSAVTKAMLMQSIGCRVPHRPRRCP